MEGRKNIAVGSRVKIKHQHWLRALEEGVVVEYRPRALNSWLVKFERGYPGGGIDGDKLYFAEGDFLAVEQHRPARAHIHEPMMTADDFMTAPNGHPIGI
ncbi:MAG TPA: hypothetical protein VGL70_22610 [Candidatus Binatia bacterium]|jgi:hypothetical protein